MNEDKPYSGDRWKYHDGEFSVVKQGNVKLTPEQQARYDEFVRSVKESVKNKHQQ